MSVRLLTLFLMFVLSPTDGFAGSGSLKFSAHSYDFGSVYQGAKVSYKFQFVNAGSGPIAVTGVHAACGCTAVETAKGRDYLPGETGFIEVFFDSTDFQGHVAKSVTVMTSEKLLPDRVLTVKANVKSEVEANPPIVDFGNIADPKAAQQGIRIRAINGFAMKLGDIAFNKDLLNVVAKKNAKEMILHVSLTDAVLPGFLKEEIRVKTNSQFMPDLVIPVRGTVKGNVEFSPAYIEFGAVMPNEAVKRSVTLQSAKPFNVVGTQAELIINGQKMTDSNPIIKISAAKFEQNKQHIAVEIVNKDAPSGAVHGKLLIQTSDEKQKQINVDFYAFFR